MRLRQPTDASQEFSPVGVLVNAPRAAHRVRLVPVLTLVAHVDQRQGLFLEASVCVGQSHVVTEFVNQDLEVDAPDPCHGSRHVPETSPPAPGILGKDDRDVRSPRRQ